ncbi:C2H2-type domain-containing protein [Plasmodiophora brassicae]|uniref:C2H2-type domain-containing protein n=1 Tax=Plasmodiophora brassicae TaxID=37360 RepID=A0A0G4IJL9_PLABS|nr:secrectory protein [Plasmodiophora brassicae]CEO95403.1 hypothetical protein PBRA_009670 [Plasmodiophora brassicae]SPQ99129.1 unnamed protein product [Plasmodiophora brassicae]
MALWKSCAALLFAVLAGGRCALGPDDDVDRDAVETYFDLNMAWNADDHDMTSNAVPNHAHAPFMGADDADGDVDSDAVKTYIDLNIAWYAHRDLDHSMTSDKGMNDIGNLGDAGDDVAMSTAASSVGRRHIERNDDVRAAVPAGTSNCGTMHDAGSHAIDHQLSATSAWASAGVASYMQQQLTTSNVDAGETTSSSVPKYIYPEVACTHCGKEVAKRSRLRHRKYHCPARKVQTALWYCQCCPYPRSFIRHDSLLKHRRKRHTKDQEQASPPFQ